MGEAGPAPEPAPRRWWARDRAFAFYVVVAVAISNLIEAPPQSALGPSGRAAWWVSVGIGAALSVVLTAAAEAGVRRYRLRRLDRFFGFADSTRQAGAQP